MPEDLSLVSLDALIEEVRSRFDSLLLIGTAIGETQTWQTAFKGSTTEVCGLSVVAQRVVMDANQVHKVDPEEE